MRVAELKALMRDRGLRGYSQLRKAELIAFLWEQSVRVPEAWPMPHPSPAPCTRPPRPTRPPPLPLPSVRFRPDKPRQPELLRKLEERNPQPPKPSTLLALLIAGCSEYQSVPTFKPYQLKSKRGKETVMEPPMEQKELPLPDPKKLKWMKKMLDEFNRKIKHSRKKHDGLIHKRNSLRKVIEGLKHGTKPEPMTEPDWTCTEHEQAFNGAYRSYRVNGRPRMDVETFLHWIRGDLIDLIKWELNDLNSARIQMATCIRFVKDEDRVESGLTAGWWMCIKEAIWTW